MSEEVLLWHSALDEAVDTIKEHEYNFDEAYDSVWDIYEHHGAGVKDYEYSLIVMGIINAIQEYIQKEE